MPDTPLPPDLPERVAKLETLAELTRDAIVRLEGRFDAQFAQFGQRFDKLDDRFDRLEVEIDRRFEKVDDRFDKVDNEINKRFEKLDDHFEKIDDRFLNTDRRIGDVAEQQAELRGMVKNLPTMWQLIFYTVGAQVTLVGLMLGAYKMIHGAP